MIDWHTHVLPGMDDGSRNIDESIAMLSALRSQGIDCVIATPHFIANSESVSDFLSRRTKSYNALIGEAKDGLPRILCGAEVSYYPGIGKMNDVHLLAIENTKLLLVEMPISTWGEYVVKDLIELACTSGLTVILAHIERYFFLQPKGVFERLRGSGILMQSNASFFECCKTKRKAIKLLYSDMIHFIGSDCHNMTSRPPKIGEAYNYVRRKVGERIFSQIDDFGYQKLSEKQL